MNAYADEETIKTTLLEGRVRVQSAIPDKSGLAGNPQSAILKPGEQAVLAEHSPLTIDHSPNLEQVVAWKNGTFSFTNASLETVMRQLARWYNIEVAFVGEMPGGTFSGEIDRSLTLDQVLKGLTKTRVHYTIQNNKLLIQP